MRGAFHPLGGCIASTRRTAFADMARSVGPFTQYMMINVDDCVALPRGHFMIYRPMPGPGCMSDPVGMPGMAPGAPLTTYDEGADGGAGNFTETGPPKTMKSLRLFLPLALISVPTVLVPPYPGAAPPQPGPPPPVCVCVLSCVSFH